MKENLTCNDRLGLSVDLIKRNGGCGAIQNGNGDNKICTLKKEHTRGHYFVSIYKVIPF